MRRRSRAGGEPVKTRRRKTVTLKRRNAPKATRNRGVSIAGQETVVARLTRERDEALLRETANSEILRLISKSPGDLELVFRTILEDVACRRRWASSCRSIQPSGRICRHHAPLPHTPWLKNCCRPRSTNQTSSSDCRPRRRSPICRAGPASGCACRNRRRSNAGRRADAKG
jgi:hypothetical protein